ncbi:MAG: hypothetical protein AB8G22_29100, partial [Saprospiraceae bacterium]
MKKRNFTNRLSLRWMVLPIIMAFISVNLAYAQPYCQLNCNDLVRIGVNDNCEALITYDLMLEDPNNPNICLPNGSSAYKIVVMTDPDDPNSVLPNSPLITSADFECGRRFYVKVKHWATDNACWGEVIVEDKRKPEVECPRDVLLECTDDPTLVYGDPRNQPGTYDNCTSNNDLVCTYEDEVVSEGCLVDNETGEELCKIIARTWTCADECGNFDTCVQYIKVRRLTCDDIIGVPNAQLSCVAWPEANLDPNAMQQPIPPSVSGEPTYRKLNGQIGRIPVSPGSHDVCKISVTYMDKILDLCGGGYKIIRTFTVLDWCAEELCDEIVQIIKVPDEDIAISCPNPWTVGTNLGATACGWLGNLPAATVAEDCSDYSVHTVVTDADGEVVTELPSNGGGPVLLPSAPCETTYYITYTAKDECGNEAECTTTITIIDDDAPTPVCDEITQVTVDAVDGIAVVYAETFDDGSHDNCCAREDLVFEVRRMGSTPWLDFVTFTCDDCPGPNMVEMRVTDCCGNISESCMVEVLVDDKTPPIITCPPNVTIECEVIADANDAVQVRNYIESTQLPLVTAYDNCEVDRIEITNIRTNLNDCGLGTIRVTYTAYDGPCDPVLSSSCTQTITIIDNTPVTVVFPPDYTAVCDNDNGNGFTGSLDPDDLPAPFNGPVITKDCELVAVNHFDETLPISDGACFKILRRWVVVNWCVYDPNGPQDPSNGYYTRTQVLKVLDQTAPVVDCPSDFVVCILDGCSATVDIPRPDATDCVPSDLLTYTVRGDFNSFSTPNVGIGSYNVIITVFDHCGNATECPVAIKVEDCKKPTPYCENGLVVELMPTTGMVEIWASDFNEGSFDNCPGELTYSFSSNTSDQGRTFTCENRGANTVQIWVTDASGNQDFCETFVNIQDNMGACGGGAAIAPLVAGSIDTEMSEDVEEVTVAVNGTSDVDMTTTTAGSFNFNLPMGGDYSITPQKDMNPLNG